MDIKIVLDVSIKTGFHWRLETDKDATLFIYIVEVAGYFDTEAQTLIDQRKAVLMDKGEEFFAQAAEKGLRFLLFSGQPIEEANSLFRHGNSQYLIQ